MAKKKSWIKKYWWIILIIIVIIGSVIWLNHTSIQQTAFTGGLPQPPVATNGMPPKVLP